MKDNDIREAIERQICNHAQHGHNIFIFDCPNCGHQVAATNVTITTERMLKTWSFNGNPIEYPEVISGTQCLACGKKFTKSTAVWVEWEPK